MSEKSKRKRKNKRLVRIADGETLNNSVSLIKPRPSPKNEDEEYVNAKDRPRRHDE